MKQSRNIKGVLFDKDGTLIDFYELWLTAAQKVVPALMEELGLPEEDGMETFLLETIGIRDGKLEADGALAYKVYGEIAEDIRAALARRSIVVHGGQMEEKLRRLFERYAAGEEVKLRPLADLPGLFQNLKSRGIAIGLATADTRASAEACLEKLGVAEYFDYVGADDGSCRPKPEPDLLLRFAEETEILPEEILVVGDTYNDICFAKSGGSIAGGVLSGVSSLEDYRGEADYVWETVAGVGKLLNLM